jgi:hypothetical protein
MTKDPNVPTDLLQAVYDQLDFAAGNLLDATEQPSEKTSKEWVNVGGWLSLAGKVGAEKVFFVDNNPVIVFARLDHNVSGNERSNRLHEFFNDIWCMARPQLLFLASPGELSVYDLSRAPVKQNEKLSDHQRRLSIIKTVVEIQTKLQKYNRAQIETGRLFEEEHFGRPTFRADESLIRDLKTVRTALINSGLSKEYAHRLIGRSIFIRYLEDRNILIESDFRSVAENQPDWLKILNAPGAPDVTPQMEKKLYPKVLSSKDFTYALFAQLAKDFNGELFPLDAEEETTVQQAHLDALQDFLRGGNAQRLFFYAYKFDVIPIGLISSIYEEFYNDESGKDNNQASHYTPSALVEFLLSQVLTPERLSKNPRIIDPACGSGIFLVEAFRRIIRHRAAEEKDRRLPQWQELGTILREQIRGIDINPDAVRVAAFSLYLAFLHYQNPPAIRHHIQQGRRLPHLKYESKNSEELINDSGQEHFDILLAMNAFDFDSLTSGVEENVRRKFSSQSADIVVGNPPWGYPNRNDKKGQDAAKVATKWCKIAPVKYIGDKELSQAFMHKSIDLLRDGGVAALLVSSGIFFKSHEESRKFRRQWLSLTTLEQVVNFVHVRQLFFSGTGRTGKAVAPFVSVMFSKGAPSNVDNVFEYWSAKKTAFIKRSKSVVLSNTDRHFVSQADMSRNDLLWKIYWWGNHQDERLIKSLQMNPTLISVADHKGKLITHSGSGFKKGTLNDDGDDIDEGSESGIAEAIPGEDTSWVKKKVFRECPIAKFDRYSTLSNDDFLPPPTSLERARARELFEGKRLLIKKSPSEVSGVKGQIIARLESDPFCFRHSIYSFRLRDSLVWEDKILLGIMWSSLARYYFFLTASSWGTWHDSIGLDEVRNFPVRLPKDTVLRERIISAVNKLQTMPRTPYSLEHPEGSTPLETQALEQSSQRELDEAVFDLYRLRTSERNLIRNMCDLGIDLFYQHINSKAVAPMSSDMPAQDYGLLQDVGRNGSHYDSFQGYLHTFVKSWNKQLEPESELRWQLIRRWQVVRPGKAPPMIAVIFSTQHKDRPLSTPLQSGDEWDNLLETLGESSVQNFNSRDIYTDGLVRIVSDPDIIIIKRNQQRLWTPSVAQEDVEATMLQVMQLQEADNL